MVLLLLFLDWQDDIAAITANIIKAGESREKNLFFMDDIFMFY